MIYSFAHLTISQESHKILRVCAFVCVTVLGSSVRMRHTHTHKRSLWLVSFEPVIERAELNWSNQTNPRVKLAPIAKAGIARLICERGAAMFEEALLLPVRIALAAREPPVGSLAHWLAQV